MKFHAVPTQPLDADFLDFLQHFYALADDASPDAHEKYVACFTPQATLVLASRCVGSDAIRARRLGVWDTTASREHIIEGVVPLHPHSADVIVWGNVRNEMKDGSTNGAEFMGRGTLVRDGGEVKWERYQAYLNTAPK